MGVRVVCFAVKEYVDKLDSSRGLQEKLANVDQNQQVSEIDHYRNITVLFLYASFPLFKYSALL